MRKIIRFTFYQSDQLVNKEMVSSRIPILEVFSVTFNEIN